MPLTVCSNCLTLSKILFHAYGKKLSFMKLCTLKQIRKRAVPLDVVPERRTKLNDVPRDFSWVIAFGSLVQIPVAWQWGLEMCILVHNRWSLRMRIFWKLFRPVQFNLHYAFCFWFISFLVFSSFLSFTFEKEKGKTAKQIGPSLISQLSICVHDFTNL